MNNYLNDELYNALQSKWISSWKQDVIFNENTFSFICEHGEWQVKKDNKTIDNFTFRLYDKSELDQTLYSIFEKTEEMQFF